MNAGKAYSRAIRVLQPTRAEMARRLAPYHAAKRAARDAIKAEIAAGASAADLYAAENAKPDRGCHYRGAALLGVLIRGISALD